MAIEKERLLSIIEFAQQSARMRSTPAATVTQHDLFAFYEHQAHDLPGIKFNASKPDDEDEIWMLVERLRELPVPDTNSAVLKPWLEVTNSPLEEPKLKNVTDGVSLIEAGTHRSSLKSKLTKEEAAKPDIDPQKTVVLEDYNRKADVRAQFKSYTDNIWRLWSEEEKRKRRTIRLYSQLFTLKQQLEGSIVEAQLELVWGVGVGIWNCNGTTVSYPLITRPVELSLNPITAHVEIRPRDMDPRLEVDWYASVDNPGIVAFERAAKEFFEKATQTFSPFDRGTFEPLLRSAVTHFDSKGAYWPNESKPEDRSLPKPETNLRVTDTWVLFARPRTNSVFLNDLERLKKAVDAVEQPKDFPKAVAAVVTDPTQENVPVELPKFRGVSVVYGMDSSGSESSGGGGPLGSGSKAKDLYFPKAFNDEQMRIVQLLEISDGVVVQGPPGTGKTHTIANVICHYLAEGRRVLVTSMKDPALAVLREQLPKEIRPLAISLLASEQEGMRQFEFAISKIASEVQAIDRTAVSRQIARLEETIDALHGRLSLIDRKVGDWAKKNLAKIELDGESVDPQDAAHEVVENLGNFEWIPDSLGVEAQYIPQFGDADVIRLREARRILGADIDYLSASLPQIVEFPESRQLLQAHQDLSRFTVLTKEVENGQVPALADSTQETLGAAQVLLDSISQLKNLREAILHARKTWTESMRKRLHRAEVPDIIVMLDGLGKKLEAVATERKDFIAKPVSLPPGLDADNELVEAVENLSEGKRPFGLMGFIGKGDGKRALESVRVVGNRADDIEDWKHVHRFVQLQKRLREFAVRWNALALELGIEQLPGTEPEHGLAAVEAFGLYRKVKDVVRTERAIVGQAVKVFPAWPYSREVADSAQHLATLEAALRHHLAKNRLAEVWVLKEHFQKILENRKGRIIETIRKFLTDELGNPTVPDSQMQASWSALMAELARVHGLSVHLATVREGCALVANGGAPKYAHQLKQSMTSPSDSLLPDNWRKAWRLRRLATYLDSIDVQEELKKLSKARTEVEQDLARAYQEIVIKRTWLKLAENASPNIRSALMAYLTAIQKIGKGTGKRAVRYRQDARMAAAQANHAVPCWIMPHYRVSESLPPELGCFDLVIIDEASQSDLTALPALLRAQKILIVGDDKQVSPEGVGLEEEKVRSLMNRFLTNQVVTYRPQMSPERSIYDLFKVVFAKSAVMLKEHFRCVGPIIEYSKREFYNHELQPLRLPKTSERLDPPLIDVIIEDGFRKGDVNLPEMRFIVDEIKKIVADPKMERRSIGMVSLLADKQALEVWERLTDEIGPELMARHRIACGDARTFQGKERDIMFLSMVVAPNEERIAPISRDTFAQRFNVAGSRARDRMYLVRSVELSHLSDKDKLRRALIAHFSSPYTQDEARVENLRTICESPFEREMYDLLTERGYWIRPQVKVGGYRIDLVVEGHNDNRLAIECDGDRYHGPDRWADDMLRQRVLERAGWTFWRCFSSTFVRRREQVVNDLLRTLTERGIDPIGGEGAPRSVHTEQWRINSQPSL
jgi:very-short-patch-repair endonuclease